MIKKILKKLEMISLPILEFSFPVSKLKLDSGKNQAIIEQKDEAHKRVIKSSEMSEKVCNIV